jgi:hypothetical protein
VLISVTIVFAERVWSSAALYFQTSVAANPIRRQTFNGGETGMTHLMRIHANRLKALGLSVFALSLAAYGGQAGATVLPVQNLTFTDFGPGGLPPKTMFALANAVGWFGPSPSDLVAIDAPGTATQTGSGSNSYAVYGPFAARRPVETSSRWTAIRHSRIRSTKTSAA